MKKFFGSIVAVLVLIVSLSSPATAQDMNYSCGVYGAGDYSEGDCDSSDNGGSTGDNGASAGDGAAGGSGSTGPDSDSGESGKDSSPDKDVEGGFFAVLFAKLMSSWGWLLFFGLLIIVGAVLLGWTWRKKHSNDT